MYKKILNYLENSSVVTLVCFKTFLISMGILLAYITPKNKRFINVIISAVLLPVSAFVLADKLMNFIYKRGRDIGVS